MWQEYGTKIIEGYRLTRTEALSILQAPVEDSLQILDTAWTIRRHFFGQTVRTNILSNAKRGLCSEDCHYCGQSQHAADSKVKFSMLSADELFKQARHAWNRGSRRFCITMAVRSASWSAVQIVSEAARTIKKEFPLEVCACLGLMTGDVGRTKLDMLKQAGVDAYNHNLNTHAAFYPTICTTHSYDDRLETIHNAREAGLSVCSGLIIGMGESDESVVDLAFTFQKEAVASIPVNFLIPIAGTKLADRGPLQPISPWKALRWLCLFRLINPSAEIRASAGRELYLRSLQAFALLAANSLFLDGYLTQSGQGAEPDLAMIADLGMEVVAPQQSLFPSHFASS
jgi:biotin synthase